MLGGAIQTRLGAALVATLGGIAGGLLVWLLGPLTPPSPLAVPQASASAAARAEAGATDVEARLDELRRQLTSLRRRSAAREALAAFNRAAESQEDEDSTGDTSLAPVIDQDDPTFELAVRGVLDRAREEQDLARQARRVIRREDRARQLTELLAEELQLSESQQQQVEQIFADQYARYRELKRAAREAEAEGPVTPRQKKQYKEQVREQTERETDRRLEEVLDREQLELFRQIREEEDLKPGG